MSRRELLTGRWFEGANDKPDATEAKNTETPAEQPTEKKDEEKLTRRQAIVRGLKKTGKILGWTILGLSGITYVANKWGPPPEQPPRDYNRLFNKLDLDKPIGVLMVSVEGKKENWAARQITYAAWNTYVDEMKDHYGDNWIAVSNANINHLNTVFAQQFNTNQHLQRNYDKLQVHFVANHHQGYYNDTALAGFLQSVHAKNKRAIIYACGPDPAPYNNAGCEYVIIPRIKNRLLGPELSFRLSPAYRDLIGMMHDSTPADAIERRLVDRSMLEIGRDRLTHNVWPRVWFFEKPPDVPDWNGVLARPVTGPALGR